MKQYKYFVAYVASGGRAAGVELNSGGRGGSTVVTNKIVSSNSLIGTEEDIRNLEEGIANELAGGMRTYVYVQIISFQLLGEFEMEEKGGE